MPKKKAAKAAPKTKLTPKQQRFVDEYLVDLNATQAAIRAGYSKKTAQTQSSRLLLNVMVQETLRKRQSKLQNKLEITQERVLQELAAVAFANGTDFVKVVGAGSAIAIPTDELSPEKLPAIAAVKNNQFGVEIKLHDKVRALELLGKHLGTFDGTAARGQLENNLFEAINACGEEDFNEIPEIQQAAEADHAVVESEDI